MIDLNGMEWLDKVTFVMLVISVILTLLILSFLTLALLSYLVFTAFGLSWSWWLPVGIWASAIMVKWFINIAKE